MGVAFTLYVPPEDKWSMNRRVRIGDVVEITTPRGLAYAQYSHWNTLCGELLRILPGFHDVRPINFAALVDQPEIFYTFLPLQSAVAQGGLAVVAHENVPEGARPFPLFRVRGAMEPGTGQVLNWWLWDGTREWRIDALTLEQRRLPIRSIWNEALLIERLTEGWTPASGDEFAAKHRQSLDTTEEAATPSCGLLHYLYFQDEAKAQRAAANLRSSGYPSEIRPATSGSDWLVLVTDRHTQTAEDITTLRSHLEELAASLGGKYDGWEMAVTG
jgi:hypothetical protein